MPDVHGLACQVDFWVERYQTLIAGFAAVAAAIWAVRPAWRQVAILEAQRTEQIRERLAATYRMLAKVIAVLDSEKWRREVKFSTRPSDEDLAGDTLRPQLLAAYGARKAKWAEIVETLRAELSGEQLALVSGDIALVGDRFTECDAALDPETVARRDAATSVHSSGEYLFYAAEHPDAMVAYRMATMRTILDGLAGDIVQAIVSTKAVERSS